MELAKNMVAERKEEIKILITSHFDQKTLTLVESSPNKNHWLDIVTERTPHSMQAVTNLVFILYKNINSTLSENVYIAFGNSISCCT